MAYKMRAAFEGNMGTMVSLGVQVRSEAQHLTS